MFCWPHLSSETATALGKEWTGIQASGLHEQDGIVEDTISIIKLLNMAAVHTSYGLETKVTVYLGSCWDSHWNDDVLAVSPALQHPIKLKKINTY